LNRNSPKCTPFKNEKNNLANPVGQRQPRSSLARSQCDQMPILFVQFLAIYDNENVYHFEQKFTKANSKFSQTINNL